MMAYWLYKQSIESSKISVYELSDLGENNSCNVPSRLFLMSGLPFPSYRGCAICPIVYFFSLFLVVRNATAVKTTRLVREESENVSKNDSLSGCATWVLYKGVQRSADVESVLTRLPFHCGRHKTDDYEESSTSHRPFATLQPSGSYRHVLPYRH